MLLQNLFQQPLEQFERYDTNQIAQYPQALAKLVEFLSSPAGGAVAGGGLAAIITGFAANAWQNRQANIFPVVFSGAEQIGRAEQNTATRFYSSVNDLAMTVTQAWNAARRQRSYEIFTQQLKNSDALSLARNVEAEGSRLLQELDSHQKLGSHAGDATSALKESWDYSSHYRYRICCYSSLNRSSPGKRHFLTGIPRFRSQANSRWGRERSASTNAGPNP